MPRTISSFIKCALFTSVLMFTSLILCGFLFWGENEEDVKEETIEPVAVEDFDIALHAIKDGYSRYHNFILIDTDRQILTEFAYITGRKKYIVQFVSTYFYDIQSGNKFIYRKNLTDKDEEYVLKTTSSGETLYKKYLNGHNYYNFTECDIEPLRKRLLEFLKDDYEADKKMTPKAK